MKFEESDESEHVSLNMSTLGFDIPLFSVREMTIRDVNEVRNMHQLVMPMSYPDEYYLEIFTSNYESLVGVDVDSGEVLGFAIGRLTVNLTQGYITTVGVLPEYQGNGFGSCLILGLMANMRNRGAGRITLHVGTSNS
jgi:ribosomal-protein-alanine N-acetyltransferase